LKHFIESQQLDKKLISELFKRTEEFKSIKRTDVLKGKILASLFYEPSTRTRFSFESAMQRLGGSVLSTENAKEFSSAVKGESLEDTIRVVSCYADCIVLRHSIDGSAKRAAELSRVPVINAGDGKEQHPTQALLDLYTIYKELGRTDDIKIAMVGDLANGRTARSLSYLLGKFNNVQITFIAPQNLRMRDDIKEYLDKHNTVYSEQDDLNAVLPEVDIVYMTRIQKERISAEDYSKANGKYVINMSNIHLLKQSARIMHPLPKVDEINLPIEVEQNDVRVAYFRQAENGLYIRMALLEHLLQ
jgi:aspartate carbamoyltransferase catalytic subunit